MDSNLAFVATFGRSEVQLWQRMKLKDLKQLSFGLSTSELNNLHKCKTAAVTVWDWHVRSDLKVLNCH